MSAADLRKKALSGSAAENVRPSSPLPNMERDGPNSSISSGATTPTRMIKTDSVINLTKPSLYGIYNDNSLLNLSKDDFEDGGMYVTPPTSKQSEGEQSESGKASEFLSDYPILKLVGKLLVLTSACFAYNEITKNLHNSHLQSGLSIPNQPLLLANTLLTKFVHKLRPVSAASNNVTSTVSWIDSALALMIQGVAMGSIHPLVDQILPKTLSKRLMSSAPRSTSSSSSFPNLSTTGTDLIRSLITFLGLSYAVRKVQWTSALQVSILWSLLNPCLWLLLDGTISGFIASTIGAGVACICVYLQSYELIAIQGHDYENFAAIWLLVASFFFCGLIIFGKLGRALF
ncbi:protein Nsg2p [[Candida] railenensis]|uniref:Protein Nsg2p n=1 Tax=[Candida] railenensis TaxID=45579 RepID=A0A9P0QUV2_9ASCO|nr:protein Nsg2p [[Candida] railenensis]